MMLSRDDPYFIEHIIGGTIYTPSSLSLIKFILSKLRCTGGEEREKSFQFFFCYLYVCGLFAHGGYGQSESIGGFMLTSLFTFLLICIRLCVKKEAC